MRAVAQLSTQSTAPVARTHSQMKTNFFLYCLCYRLQAARTASPPLRVWPRRTRSPDQSPPLFSFSLPLLPCTGKTYRFRISSIAGLASQNLLIEGHTLTVIMADGYAVKPFVVGAEGLDVYPGQTVDVLLKANKVWEGTAQCCLCSTSL